MYLPLNNEECDQPGSSVSLSKKRIIALTVAALTPVIFPFIHLGIISHIWDEFNFKVNIKDCSCSCWDTVFKGIYERGPASYKHVYFNVTSNTLKIWFTTVLAIILLYEAMKRTLKLYFDNKLRFSMLVLFGCSIYPNYYSWWSCFNYWNDDYYKQWNHQMFFSSTELASTIIIVHLLDKMENVTSRKVLGIMSIALLHIISSGFDQFVENVIRGNGMLHQVLRDVFFMIPDFLLLLIPYIELKKVAKIRKLPITHLISNKDFGMSVGFILTGWLVCLIL